jgi:tetratricopeptide (TPR) repeat protein
LEPEDLGRLGKAYVETKRDSLAARTLEEAAQLNPDDAEVQGALGVLYMQQKQFEKAAAAFEKRFLADSTATSAYINYALSNMALGKWESARVALLRALQQKPDYLKGHLYLARCYTPIDSFAQAKRECETVVQLAATNGGNGNNGDTHKDEIAEAHSLIGFVWLLDKNYPKALEALNASIRLVNSNPQTRLWRAQTLALSGKREEAIAEYKAVLKLDPNNQTAKKDLATLTQQ